MLALGPIFIICGLFEGTRGLFEGWLKAAVLFALTPLLAVLIGGATIAHAVADAGFARGRGWPGPAAR